jgi:hypothetical protein
MPPKNRTACKRRKCQRSRSHRRRNNNNNNNNNNRRTRSIRGGGLRSRVNEWRQARADRAAVAETASQTRRANNEPAKFRISPLRWARNFFTRRPSTVDRIAQAVHNVSGAQTMEAREGAIRDLSNQVHEYTGDASRKFDNQHDALENVAGNTELAYGFGTTSQATNAQEVDDLMSQASQALAEKIAKLPAPSKRKPPPPSPPRGPRPNAKEQVPSK